MSSLDSVELHYEDMVTKNKLRKKDLKMSDKAPTKKPTTAVVKTKNTLSVYTYLNFKQFGLAVRIENGIKTTFLWFETHITFEKR